MLLLNVTFFMISNKNDTHVRSTNIIHFYTWIDFEKFYDPFIILL